MGIERLLAAAKELTRYLWKVQDWSGTYVETCIDDVEAAISDAEQQAADDALPYSSEWAISEFGGWFFMAGGVELLCEPKGIALNGANSHCSEVKTRGQLRRLVAALKGGE